jgi:hypothetical protein
MKLNPWHIISIGIAMLYATLVIGLGAQVDIVSEEQEACILPAPLPAHGYVEEWIIIERLQGEIAINEYIISTLTARIEAAQRNLNAP